MTNRCAIDRAGDVGAADLSNRASSDAASAGITALPAFSTEKREIICGFPLSKSWKSSFWKVPIALPFPFRTTTGTITRFTFVEKVAGES